MNPSIKIHIQRDSRTTQVKVKKGNMDFDLEDPLANFKEQQNCSTISELFALESDHMPSPNCFSFSYHFEAISLILKLQLSCNLDSYVTYLAINYLNRFMSRQEIPGKPWLIRLIAISCLSLASKMKNTHLSYSELQKEGCSFDDQSIQKMELVILGALNWRMRSITPFPFLNFFISLAEIKDLSVKHALKERASEITFSANLNDMKLVVYKPSTIAAAAIIFASYELFPQQYSILRSSITACEFIEEETLSKCFDLMQEVEREEVNEVMTDISFLSTETPLSVLERSTKRKRI